MSIHTKYRCTKKKRRKKTPQISAIKSLEAKPLVTSGQSSKRAVGWSVNHIQCHLAMIRTNCTHIHHSQNPSQAAIHSKKKPPVWPAHVHRPSQHPSVAEEIHRCTPIYSRWTDRSRIIPPSLRGASISACLVAHQYHTVHSCARFIDQSVSVPSGSGVSLLPQGGGKGVHFTHLIHRRTVVVVGNLEAHPDGLLQRGKWGRQLV